MLKFFPVLVVVVVLAGCASVAPVASSAFSSRNDSAPQVHTQTSVNLAGGNFVVIKTNVVGCSKGFTLLGLVPIYPARLTKAMDRLYAAAGIQAGSSKTLAHLIVEHSSVFWLLFSIPETTVRADIVQFNSKAEPDRSTNQPPGGSP